MTEEIIRGRPPRGLFAVLARLPIWLYRLRAGWLLGSRFLLLEHRGRQSGRLRRAVLELIDRDDEEQRYFVAAAWGRRAQWVRNVLYHPEVRITVGRHKISATAETLSPEHSEEVLRRYGQRHRVAAAALARLFGRSSFDELAGTISVVEFKATGHPGVNRMVPGAKYSGEPADARVFSQSQDRAYTRFARLYDLAVKVLPVWKTWLRQALPELSGPRVLEVSFGTGYLMTQYAARFETHGLEFNRRMVDLAAANLKSSGLSAELIRGDVQTLPYRSASFDTVLSTMAFSAYPNGRASMSELARVLKPGGRLVMIDIGYPEDGNWWGTRLASAWKLTGDLLRDLRPLMRDAALEVAHIEIGGCGSVHLYVATKPG